MTPSLPPSYLEPNSQQGLEEPRKAILKGLLVEGLEEL